MLLLFALSITAAYLVFEHFLTIRRQELVPESLQNQLRELLSHGKADGGRGGVSGGTQLAVVRGRPGIGRTRRGLAGGRKGLEDALAEQAARLLRRIEYLSVIGNIAPMVGLLGTVTGMIIAFQQVASSQGSAGAGELAEGIYQALVTTVGRSVGGDSLAGGFCHLAESRRSAGRGGNLRCATRVPSVETSPCVLPTPPPPVPS